MGSRTTTVISLPSAAIPTCANTLGTTAAALSRDRDDDRDEERSTVEHVLDVALRALLLQPDDPDADGVYRDHRAGHVVPPGPDARRPQEGGGERGQQRPQAQDR